MVGGKGTRLYPLTETRPKPVLPVLNKPCLRYLIESMAAAGIEEVFLACGYKSDKIAEAIGDGSDLGIRIIYSEEDTPLGTGGAMKKLEGRLDQVFIAANGDTFADIDIKEEIAAHLNSAAAVTIALTRVKNPCEFGIVRVDATGRILEFKEKPKPEEVFSDLVNAGIYVVDRRILADVPADSFFDFSKDLVPILMKRGDRIQGYVLKGVWHDVGRPSDLLATNLLMASRLYDNFIWDATAVSGCQIVKPLYLGDGTAVAGSTVTAAVVMHDSTIKNSRIVNSVVMPGCRIENADIENTILGEGCTVGRGARVLNAVLRDGTAVAAGQFIDGRVG